MTATARRDVVRMTSMLPSATEIVVALRSGDALHRDALSRRYEGEGWRRAG